jgi:hypothetical protein
MWTHWQWARNASLWWLWQRVPHVLSLPCPCDTASWILLLSSSGNLKLLLMNLIQYHTHKSMIKQTSLTPQFLDEIILNKWIQVSCVSVVNIVRTGSRLKPDFQQARQIESLFLSLKWVWIDTSQPDIMWSFWFWIWKYYLDVLCVMGKGSSVMQLIQLLFLVALMTGQVVHASFTWFFLECRISKGVEEN